MRLLNGIASSVLFMIVFAGIACAQDRLVPLEHFCGAFWTNQTCHLQQWITIIGP
jgi:thiosulfate reductase cytochrome b subunit